MGKRIDRYLDGAWQNMLPNSLGKTATIILKTAISLRGTIKSIENNELTLSTRPRKYVKIALPEIQEVHLEWAANW
jgi:ribosome maturation factor RimP